MALPRSWVAAIAASAALHLVLLAVPGWQGVHGDWAIGQRPSRAMDVRLLQASGAGPTEAPAVAAVAAETPPAARPVDASARMPSMPVPENSPSRDPAAQDGYLPPEKLTRRPQALSDVVIPAAENGAQIGGPQVGVFTLFIDTSGTVRRMVIDGPTLTPGLEALARQAFMAARFSPGEVAGRPVKSLLRIEVDFGAPPSVPLPDIAVQLIPVG
ncbi:MAG: hypothetical protein V4505_03705 [Pseudomonadota bacterium]